MKSGNTCGHMTVRLVHTGEITISMASETCYITQEHFIIFNPIVDNFPLHIKRTFVNTTIVYHHCVIMQYKDLLLLLWDVYNVYWKYAREFNKQFEKTVQGGTNTPLHVKETLHTLNIFLFLSYKQNNLTLFWLKHLSTGVSFNISKQCSIFNACWLRLIISRWYCHFLPTAYLISFNCSK